MPETKTSFLNVRQVTKTFSVPSGDLPVLDGVSFAIEDGTFACIIGPSGCGKTTLIKILAGVLPFDSGQIVVHAGQSKLQAQVAYMPQSDTLLPWRTAFANALLPAQIERRSRVKAIREAQDLFARFGLSGFEDLYPVELSGGMKQRLALMRTFLSQRDILLLDEPLGALDALTRAHLQDWLLSVWQEMKKTILLVTHDVEEALLLSDRIILMSARPAYVHTDLVIDLPRPRACSDATLVRQKEDLLKRIFAEERDG
ncbi:MAG TPA: ABC transporter ATP-binding protein [Candidatus Acetothermia bacterium]|nr:ABC transporter ATP-binding protein [Candidatus Acetothermia bacterium]